MTTAKRAATRLPSLAAVALVAALAALACGRSSGAIPAEHPAAARGPCSAERVLSGERVDLRCGQELVRVRLSGVAAPRAGHEGYTEAGRALRELLRERTVFVEISASAAGDRDGRMSAYVRDGAGQNLNVAMVLLGWATYAPADDPGRLARNFELAESEARREQRAMWSVWPVTAERADAR